MAIVIITPAGDLDLPRGIITGPEYIGQRIMARLQFFRGEWFLDQRQGVPYFRDILRQGVDVDVVRSILRGVVLDTPGVLSVEEFVVSPGPEPRSLQVRFSATTTEGTVADDAIFIV